MSSRARVTLSAATVLCLLSALVVTFAAPAEAGTTALVVNKAEDTADGSCDLEDCSLREAIIQANSTLAQDTITLPGGIGTYNLTLCNANDDTAAQGDLDILADVVINGGGSGTTIIDGCTEGVARRQTLGGFTPDRVFELVQGETRARQLGLGGSGGATATINDVTIQGGTPTNEGVGGGILIGADASLTLNDSVVQNNFAFIGGGIERTGRSSH